MGGMRSENVMLQQISEAPPADTGVATQTEAAARLLSKAILAGDIPAGARLNIREISTRTGIGPTPVREALANLAGRGLVTFSGQRGFRVVPISREDLSAILTARNVVEKGALALSIANGDGEWEVELVASLHRLKMFTDNPPAQLEQRIETFEQVHRQFHLALIGACGSDRLISIFLDLYDQTRRYRALLVKDGTDRNDAFDKHDALVRHCLARDERKALDVLADHNGLLLETIYDRPR